MTTLFDPVQLGALQLSNRIIMSPLTRCRADADRVPGDLIVEYYRQRATAGLIISEATAVTPWGVGYPDTPGIWTQAQIMGWKRVTQAVHEAGGKIILQLWHVGRVSDPIYLHGMLPLAPSALAQAGHVSLIRPEKPHEVPRALEHAEIAGVVESFRQGAINAKTAGFDGVEVHGANGYLLEQFLADGSNKRTDEYGGSIENRSRLLLEITDAVISIWGADHVGVHLSPRMEVTAEGDSNREALFRYLAEQLGKREIAFVFTREHADNDSLMFKLASEFNLNYIANESFDKALAEEWIESGKADAIAFGVPFIANPDLPERLRTDAPLNEPDSSTFYACGPEGYTDYPFMK